MRERDSFQDLNRLTVTTVDGVIGQQADYIILSMVRTKGVGFLDDRRRINVALSRCK